MRENGNSWWSGEAQLPWLSIEGVGFVQASGAETILFFFSSRRRHTRFDCDWSSDVCSSDLALQMTGRAPGVWAIVAGSGNDRPYAGRSTRHLERSARHVDHPLVHVQDRVGRDRKSVV